MYDPKSNFLLSQLVNDLELDLTVQENRVFFARLAVNFYDIHSKFERIYRNQKGCDKHFTKLIRELLDYYRDRPQSFKDADLNREKDSDWLISQKWAGIMLYIDRFNVDLKGFENKLNYLAELGINLVHLMTVWESPGRKNDGGYAVSNYSKVDPKYGDLQDLEDLIREFKKRGMVLMLDLVINHTSDQHQWAKKAKRGVKKYQKYYYMFDDRTVPDLFERSLPEVFPASDPGNFTFDQQSQKWAMTVFHNYQWDLNYYNPEVFREMLKLLFFQANLGIDIIRIDAPAFIWKKMGTQSQNETEAHLILQMFKACLQVVAPGTALIAEAIVSPQEIMKYFGQSTSVSNECDIAYNASLMALLWDAIATRNSNLLRAGLTRLPKKPAGTTWLNYVRGHNDIGLSFTDAEAKNAGFTPELHRKFLVGFLTGNFEGSFARGLPFMPNPKTGDARISGSLASLAGLEAAMDQKDSKAINNALKRINLLHSIIVSFGGIPMIYYGDEVATLNDYGFAKEADKVDDNRWVHRPRLNWETIEKRKQSGTIQNVIFSNLQRFIKIRGASPEFADLNNCQIIDTGNHYLFAYLRYRDRFRTLVVCNLKDDSQQLSSSVLTSLMFDLNQKLVDKLTGTEVEFPNQKMKLKPYQFVWITKRQ